MRIWLESIRRNNWERDREYFKKLFLIFFSYFFSCVLFSLVLFCWFLLNLRNMHGKAFRKRLLLYCVRMCVFFFKYSSIWNDSCCSFAHLTRNWNETSFFYFRFPFFSHSQWNQICVIILSVGCALSARARSFDLLTWNTNQTATTMTTPTIAISAQ